MFEFFSIEDKEKRGTYVRIDLSSSCSSSDVLGQICWEFYWGFAFYFTNWMIVWKIFA